MSEAPATARSSPPKVSRRFSALVNFALSHVNTLLVITQGIILVPLYLACIPDALYGAWLATGNILSWIELVDPGVSAVLTQRVANTYGAGDLRRLSRVIGTGLTLSFALAALPLLAWPFAGYLGDLSRAPAAHHATLAWSFRLGLLGTAMTFCSYATTSVLVGLQLTLWSGAVYLTAAVVGITTTLVLLLSGVGLPSIPLGLLARAAVLFVGTGVLVGRWSARYLPTRLSFDRAELRGIMGTSAYTFVSRVGVTLAGRMDAFLSASLMNPLQTTVLSLTGRALDPVRMVAGSVGSSLQSGIAHLLGEGGRARAAEVMELAGRAVAAWTVFAAGSVVALNHVFVALWVGPQRFGSGWLTVLLALAMGLSTFTASLNQLVFAANGIRASSVVGLAEAILKVSLQVVLVRRYGLVGMPLAAIVASLTVPAWMLPRIAAELVDVPPSRARRFWAWQGVRLAAGVCAGAAVSWCLRRAAIHWTWPRFILAAAVIGSVFASVSIATDRELRRRVLARLVARARRSPPETPSDTLRDGAA